MATKLSFGDGQVNVSQRVAPEAGEVKRMDKPVEIKTTVVRPASARPVKSED